MNSEHVREGVQSAPHRSLFNALGYTKEEMKKPMIGVVCSYNEIVPGHINLDKIAEAVKMGIVKPAVCRWSSRLLRFVTVLPWDIPE